MNFQIRAVEKADLEALLALNIDSQLYQKQALEKESVDIEAFKNGQRDIFEKWVTHPDKKYLVAVDHRGQIVGFILCFTDKAVGSRGAISDLYVLPEARGQGVGRALMEEGIKWLESEGMTTVGLAVHKSNTSAINLYRELGFGEISDNYLLLEKGLN